MARRQTPATRARDADRNDACQLLDTALTDGQLSMTEHRDRIASATSATTLGDLQSLVQDLQRSRAHAPAPKPALRQQNRRRAMLVAIAAVLIGLGVAIGWIATVGPDGSESADPGAGSATAADDSTAVMLHSPNGLEGLVESMRTKFGDATGYSLLVGEDWASLFRADPSDARIKLVYGYSRSWSEPSTQPLDSTDRLVDLGRFNVDAVVGRLRGTPQILGIEQRDVDKVILEIDPSTDPTTRDAVEITIRVYTIVGGHGTLTIDPQGNVLKQVPPAPA